MPQKRKRRTRPYRPGDRVLIVTDCREGGPATGQVAVYEGIYVLRTNTRLRGSRAGTAKLMIERGAVPRMRLKDGSYIWGIECWWTPVRSARRAYESLGLTDKLAELDAAVNDFTGMRELLERLTEDDGSSV
jgi:hypothetical protein